MINLVSDTITTPTPAMLEAMWSAEVGDDVFGQDPTVNQLELKMAQMFGKEAAVFCPSGTMTNQIAIKVHTQPLDEVICNVNSHIYQYESAGFGFLSGISVNLLPGKNGKITANQIESSIKPDFDWLPRTSLVVLENTCNKGGGSIYRLSEIRPISDVCKQRGLGLHLDGARLFNALVETEETPEEVGHHFDSISICLSKGLGAPIGSVLIGSANFIKHARRVRKVLGGGMRQVGYLAAAGIYALDHHLPKLKEDNVRARAIGEELKRQSWVAEVRPVESNIIIFDLKAGIQAGEWVQKMENKGVQTIAFGPQTIRMVTHLNLSDGDINRVIDIIKNY
jgi:threonine aldolase